MEMRKLFSNSGAEINKKEIAALVVLVLFVFFLLGLFVQSHMNLFTVDDCVLYLIVYLHIQLCPGYM